MIPSLYICNYSTEYMYIVTGVVAILHIVSIFPWPTLLPFCLVFSWIKCAFVVVIRQDKKSMKLEPFVVIRLSLFFNSSKLKDEIQYLLCLYLSLLSLCWMKPAQFFRPDSIEFCPSYVCTILTADSVITVGVAQMDAWS